MTRVEVIFKNGKSANIYKILHFLIIIKCLIRKVFRVKYYTKEIVEVKDIVPMQEYVDLSFLIPKLEPAITFRFRGKYYIMNGHHRVADKITRGVEQILVKVVK